jgi:dipeptidyl aminopeptidase/acylaminoacyl peptidase
MIFTIGSDGTREFLTRGSGPDWSPDGTRIALSRNGDIWVVDLPGTGEPRRLTSAPEREQWPDWSPDGTQIAFEREPGTEDPTFDVMVTNADGSGQPVNLTPGADKSGGLPDWSRDGIVFQRKGALWLIAAAGDSLDVEGQSQFFNRPGYGALQPAWSPNGSRSPSSSPNTPGALRISGRRGGRNCTNLTRGPVTGRRRPCGPRRARKSRSPQRTASG